MTDKTKKPLGQFTHWARPNWIRMYDYNYEYGESYYRNQVRYVSTSSVLNNASSIESRKSYLERRSAAPPPRASSFIERWSADPFYGKGFRSSRSESARASSSSYASTNLLSQIRSIRESTASVLQESQNVQEQLRSRRARSVEARSAASADYRARSIEARNAAYGSDDCLMRSTALDASSRSRRAQSVAASEMEVSSSRQVRASSVARSSSVVRSSSVERSSSLSRSSAVESEESRALRHKQDNHFAMQYPIWSSLACNETCPTVKGESDSRRFVMGNKYMDAAAIGGFDVLYDPSAYSKTRTLLKRLSEERDVYGETRVETRANSRQRESESQARSTQSSSRLAYKYNTIY